jgi:transposase
VDGLKQSMTIYKNRLHAYKHDVNADPFLMEECTAMIQFHQNQIDKIETEIIKIVKQNFDHEYEKILKIPGVGEKTASLVIGVFGKFENFDSAKKVVSFIGINPNPRESGSSVRRGSSISKKGNSLLRKILYMAAISASRHNPSCAALYNRLLEKGKAKKKAFVAVANKLIRQIFAVIKFDREWDINYGK